MAFFGTPGWGYWGVPSLVFCVERASFSRGLCLFMPIGISGLPAPPSLSLTYMREKKPRAFTPCCSLSPMVLSQSAFFSVLFSLLIFVLYTVFGVLGCKWKGEYGKEQLSPWK